MMQVKLVSIFAIIQMALAENTRPLEYINVAVGPDLRFTHPAVPAGVGDVVIFGFAGGPGNHSVIQTSYDNPCVALPGGFNSGFLPYSKEPGSNKYFLVTVKNTDPIYYYCGQIGHCQAGMVGVINPPCIDGYDAPGSFLAFQDKAKAVKSVGPVPSVIQGGQLSPSFPSGSPVGPPGPWFTGFSASCTGKDNSTDTSSSVTSKISTSTPGTSILSSLTPCTSKITSSTPCTSTPATSTPCTSTPTSSTPCTSTPTSSTPCPPTSTTTTPTDCSTSSPIQGSTSTPIQTESASTTSESSTTTTPPVVVSSAENTLYRLGFLTLFSAVFAIAMGMAV